MALDVPLSEAAADSIGANGIFEATTGNFADTLLITAGGIAGTVEAKAATDDAPAETEAVEEVKPEETKSEEKEPAKDEG